MAEYELVHEIQNQCRRNQMRDVFFSEVTCDDPAEYVRRLLKGRVELTADEGPNGEVTIYADCDGLPQKFVFTPI